MLLTCLADQMNNEPLVIFLFIWSLFYIVPYEYCEYSSDTTSMVSVYCIQLMPGGQSRYSRSSS